MALTEIVKHPEFNPESSHIVRYGRVLHDSSCSRGFLFGGVKMGRPKLNLIGEIFGRLTVLEWQGVDRTHNSKWLCLCECGEVRVILGYNLTILISPISYQTD